MKKRFSLLMGLTLVFTLLAGCGNGGSASSTPTASDGGGHALTVGIVQLAENGAFSDMRQGFIDHMRELGYDESKMSFVFQEAGGDVATLNTICQSMVDKHVDLLVTIATPATQAAVNLDTDIPVFFISVSDPVAAGIITDMDHPDKNATGTSNAIPVGDIFKLAAQITPDVKTYGILYNTSETNSVTTVAKAKDYLDEQGLKYVEKVVTNSAEVQQAAQALADQADALYVPNDSMIQSAMPQVVDAATAAGIPIYGSSPVMVASGALATVSTSDPAIGALTADMVDKYLTGTAVADIPAVVDQNHITVVNSATAQALGITIPDSLNATTIGG
ncbi:MAG: ABC transporter substrate-binding protein [Intestinimonas sp.]|nr:ABC transporter substrate-binding protein [Intestinimonas sp.]